MPEKNILTEQRIEIETGPYRFKRSVGFIYLFLIIFNHLYLIN